MDLGLDGKVILVTGGSDGLGRALCGRLVEEGARVALCARDGDRLREAARGLRAMGGDVLDVVADVTEPADLERFVTGAMGRCGRIDGLVNNAVVFSMKSPDAPLSAWKLPPKSLPPAKEIVPLSAWTVAVLFK